MIRKRAPRPTELPFEGFLATEAFITAKGNRAVKNPILWGRVMLEAIRLDDEAIAAAALESPLADVNAVVTGGAYGSAYEIGGLAFFAQHQMERQHQAAVEKWRKQRPDAFVSPSEWKEIDEDLASRSSYAPVDKVTASATAGDSLLHLSLRGQALTVAAFLVDSNIDLLVENRRQETVMTLVRDIFLERYRELRALVKERPDEMQEKVRDLLVDKCGPICALLDKLVALLNARREQLEAEQIVRTYEHTEDPDEDEKLQRCRGMLELAHDIAEAYQQRLVRH